MKGQIADYSQELAFAKQLALKAGYIFLKYFAKTTIKVKSNITPVTEADIAVSELVTEEIKKNFPHHALIDEELNSVNTGSEFQWVCDPIDGTIPFSRAIPTSMFSLALCKNEEPVVGVIYDPYMKRLVSTQKGGRVMMNDTEIKVSKSKLTKGEAIFIIPNWLEDFDINKFFLYTKKNDYILTMVESFVYQGMLVASGNSVVSITASCSPWDRAATKLIVENAGGLITDELNNPLTVFGAHKMAVVSNGVVHEEILRVIQDCLIQ